MRPTIARVSPLHVMPTRGRPKYEEAARAGRVARQFAPIWEASGIRALCRIAATRRPATRGADVPARDPQGEGMAAST